MRISQCDMSFQGLYPNKTGVVSGANWNLEEHFGSNKKSPQNDLISVLLHIFFGKNDFEVEKNIKAPPFCWVDKQTLSMKVLHFRIGSKDFWVVVPNIFYFHPDLGKIPILTSIFFKWVESTN